MKEALRCALGGFAITLCFVLSLFLVVGLWILHPVVGIVVVGTSIFGGALYLDRNL